MFKGAETKENKKEGTTSGDLMSYGGSKAVTEALIRIHPGVRINYSKDELVELLNKADITKDELKELTEMRDLEETDKNKLDYKEKFYDVRKRIDDAISEMESGEAAAYNELADIKSKLIDFGLN